MGVDTDLGVIFSDIVRFLESLSVIDLPLDVENARDNLLQRTKIKFVSLTNSRESTSPEPYLDMNAGKGLLQSRINKGKQNEIEEYVGADQQTLSGALSSRQSTDYYESFNEFGETNVGKINALTGYARDEQFEDKIRDIYKTFTRAETRSKALKYSNLEQKIERKSFAFLRDTIRPCWIGLVGSHLIIYENDDKQPPEIFSIRGYKARAAPSAVPKDPERAKSAFEIFSPGNKTLQFIAGSPKEMAEWVSAIDRTGTDLHKNNAEIIHLKQSEDTPINRKPEISVSSGKNTTKSHNGKETLSSCETKKKSVELSEGNSPPPIIPVRLLPRRLPSLPNEQIVAQVSSYEPMDNCYEEDDIYHKIEDFRYENVKEKSEISGSCQKVRSKKGNKRKKSKESTKQASPAKQIIETYDDVQTIVRENRTSMLKDDRTSNDKDDSFLTYDDVAHTSQMVNMEMQNIGENSRTKIDRSPTKSSPKRWFLLDRVRNKKESPKKEEKPRVEERKCRKKLDKGKEKVVLDTTPPPISGEPDIITEYDDVSELVDRRTKVDLLSNYNCPPPPRPIYAKSSSRNQVSMIENREENKEILDTAIVEQVYDDIANYRNNAKIELPADNGQSGNMDCKNILSSRVSVMFGQDNNENLAGNHPAFDSEHYQIPRSNTHHLNDCCVAAQQHQQQELYDDIAILADFRARQRDSVISTGDKLTISIKKPWNRFGSGKKTVPRHVPTVETPKKNTVNHDLLDASETNSILSSADKHDAAKLNKLQKLYNKVESTLGKQPSVKSIDPLLNKPHKSE